MGAKLNLQKLNIDLHVHSIHSNRPAEFMLQKVNSGECYTQPREVYDRCRARGMDLVTITDHDGIDGAMEIAHLPGTFMSEEITASFPEDGVKVHVVALDINETQHHEIQRARNNIYDLAHFMRAERIPHFVAHPLSEVKGRLSAAHVQKLILLFKHLEGMNGTRDRIGGQALERIVGGLTQRTIYDWAERHNIRPIDWNPARYLTAGSDDHGRLNIARAFTSLEATERSIAGFRDAFFAGRVSMGGEFGSPDVLSHNIYSVTIQYFKNSSSNSLFTALDDDENDEEEIPSSEPGTQAGRTREIAEIVRQTIKTCTDFSPMFVFDNSHTDEAQAQLGELGRRIINALFTRFVGGLIQAIEDVDLERAFEQVPGILSASSVVLPYLFGYRYLVRDREDAERLAAEIGFGYSPEQRLKVAVFTDTGFDVNGVNFGLRRMIQTLRNQGREIELVTCATPPRDHQQDRLEKNGGLRNLERIGEFKLPVYQEMSMGIPSLVDVMNYLAEEHISVVQLSTPGPLGIVAFLAAKLMGIPIVSNYHTEIPTYTAKITGDPTITAIAAHWTGWFYRQADRVVAPSEAAKQSLVRLGVGQDKISILPRGVDTTLFSATKRDAESWSRFGLNGAPKLLYVGRVSREKGLDTLVKAFEILRRRGAAIDLAVVGEGPYLEALKERVDDPRVRFLGYRRGEELAQIFASADVFVFPSATDTFGNVVLEAQASGLPSVVVDRGGPAEQVTCGQNGFIVNADDAAEMARAVQELLLDSGLRQRMGSAALRRARSLSLAASAAAQWRLYRDLWGRDSSPHNPGRSSRIRSTIELALGSSA